MKPIKEMSIGELGAFVQSHLIKNNVHCVLSGGACVSIYTKNQYESFDLDFIENVSAGRKKLFQLLSELGFVEENRYFRHPDTPWFIEFPTGPLAIGNEPVDDILRLEFSTGSLLLLSPTESVRDRLSAFYYWDDLQALQQACMIALEHEIDLNKVRIWSVKENHGEKFAEFLRRINKDLV